MSQETVWSVNGSEFEFDIQDADNAERYEAAFAKFTEREKTLPMDGKSSAFIRAYHDLFKCLFDDILGEGSGVKIVGEKANSRVATETYMEFLKFIETQKNSTMDMKNQLIQRYSPNRAQRRHPTA